MSARLAAAAIVIFYAVLGLRMLSPEAVYSGDIGVKYVQAQALVDQRFTTLDIPYPGEFLDPDREFFPIRPPFVMNVAGTTQSIFPPAASVLQAVAVAAGGFRGMVGLSILAAAAVVFATLALAPPGCKLPAVVAIGVAGPLWFYAISGWEHAPAVAFGAAAFAVAWRGRPHWRSAALAGVLAGLGATLRDEVVLLIPGLLLAVWIRERGWRPLAAVIAGALLPLVLAAAVEVWWFERPAAAHLRHAVHILQSALHVTDEPNPELPVLKPMTPRERYDTVVVYWLFGRGTDRQVVGFAAAFAVALLIRWRLRSSIGLLVWLAAFGVTAADDVREVVTAPKWLAGLIRVSPFVVFGMLPFAAGRRASPEGHDRWLPAVVLATAAAYLALAFAGVDTSGGKSLGPRLLLPLLPLLAVSSLVVIATYLRSSSGVERLVGWTGVALFAMAVVIHAGGTIPAYLQRNNDDAAAIRAAASSPERVVVADDPFTAQLLFPLYDRKIVLLADTQAAGSRLGERLSADRVGGALLISRNPEPKVTLDPMRLDRTDLRGRMVVQSWSRVPATNQGVTQDLRR